MSTTQTAPRLESGSVTPSPTLFERLSEIESVIELAANSLSAAGDDERTRAHAICALGLAVDQLVEVQDGVARLEREAVRP